MRPFTRIQFSFLLTTNKYSRSNHWISTIRFYQYYSFGPINHRAGYQSDIQSLYSRIKCIGSYSYTLSDAKCKESNRMK